MRRIVWGIGKVLIATLMLTGSYAVDLGKLDKQPAPDGLNHSFERRVSELEGLWKVRYHPNQAIRIYMIDSKGFVTFGDQGGWKDRIAQKGNDLLIRFDSDAIQRVERLTKCVDGRLMVEHYNPGTMYPNHPDQIGIGKRVQAGFLPGYAYTALLNGKMTPDPEEQKLDEKELKRLFRLLGNEANPPERLFGHEVTISGVVQEEGIRPLLTLGEVEQTMPFHKFQLLKVGSDIQPKVGDRMQIRGKLVEYADGKWWLWILEMKQLKN